MTNQITFRTGKKLFGADPNDRSAPIEHIPEYSLPEFPKEALDRIVRRETKDVTLEFRGRLIKFAGLGDGRYTVDYGDSLKITEPAVEKSEMPDGLYSPEMVHGSAEIEPRATASNNLSLVVALIATALSLTSFGLQLFSDAQRKAEEDRLKNIEKDLTRKIDELVLFVGKKSPPEPSNLSVMQSELSSISKRIEALEERKIDSTRSQPKTPEKTNRQRKESGN